MLLKDYAEQHQLIEKRLAKVLKVIPGKDSYTIHYRIDGQKYRDTNDVSKRTLSTELYNKIEVDETTGNILSGVVVRKSNFLIWDIADTDEA